MTTYRTVWDEIKALRNLVERYEAAPEGGPMPCTPAEWSKALDRLIMLEDEYAS